MKVAANNNAWAAWQCRAWEPRKRIAARCTEMAGHVGDHIANVDSDEDDFGSYPAVLARWKRPRWERLFIWARSDVLDGGDA